MRQILTSEITPSFPKEHHGRFTPTEAILCLGAACPSAFGLVRARAAAMAVARDARTADRLDQGIERVRNIARHETATLSPDARRDALDHGIAAIDEFIKNNF